MSTDRAKRAGRRSLAAVGVATSAARDRFGMACAIVAVACLSCLIANWSHQYPVVHSRWEQDLFGDLRGPDQHRTLNREANRIEGSAATEELAAQDDPSSDLSGHSPMKPSIFQAMFSQPIAERAPEDQPRFVEREKNQETASTPSVWLSGVIEVEVDEEPISRTRTDSLNRL